MPAFVYKAKKGPSEVVKGSIDAPSRVEAIKLIEEKGFIPVEVIFSTEAPVTPSGEKKIPAEAVAKPKTEGSAFFHKISATELCIFTRQFSSLLQSNVTLLRAIEIIKNQTHNKKMKALLESVAADMHNGSRFSDALERFGEGCFDTRYLSMVRSGETGGSLGHIFETLADSLERQEEIRGQVRSALAYPLLIILVGSGTLFVLFTFCLPRLTALFNQTQGSLPPVTRILMAMSHPTSQMVFWGVFLTLLLSGFLFFFRGSDAKVKRDRFLMKLPVFGEIKLKSDVARFCDTLAMLIDNGIPVYQSFEVARPVLFNEILKEELKEAQNRILAGEMLSAVLKESVYFPPFVVDMIAVGEEGGRLTESLREVVRFYNRDSQRGIKIITTLIEPAFILVIAVVVGIVVSGIMLPIFNMNWIK